MSTPSNNDNNDIYDNWQDLKLSELPASKLLIVIKWILEENDKVDRINGQICQDQINIIDRLIKKNQELTHSLTHLITTAYIKNGTTPIELNESSKNEKKEKKEST
eukprot:472663_1